jgi:hypothetical protein
VHCYYYYSYNYQPSHPPTRAHPDQHEISLATDLEESASALTPIQLVRLFTHDLVKIQQTHNYTELEWGVVYWLCPEMLREDRSSMLHSSCTMSPCMPWSLCTCGDGNDCWSFVSTYSLVASTMPCKTYQHVSGTLIKLKVRKLPSTPCHIGDTLAATRATTIRCLSVTIAVL